jgi:hypothetical protein
MIEASPQTTHLGPHAMTNRKISFECPSSQDDELQILQGSELWEPVDDPDAWKLADDAVVAKHKLDNSIAKNESVAQANAYLNDCGLVNVFHLVRQLHALTEYLQTIDRNYGTCHSEDSRVSEALNSVTQLRPYIGANI